MPTPPVLALALVLLAATAPAAAAQRLTEIGQTSIGTPVFLEPRSVSRADGIVTATVRVALQPPLKHSAGDLRSSRTIAMYNCAKQTVATKESWYYLDTAGTKVGMHKVVKIPGFGPSFKGSLADVAMRHLCAAAPR
ncbi:MAG: hypothetical protein P3C10_14090 [Gemmatimonadota bacterium]|nr:hypothetical protein [Gemmatimonadota bacterium]